MVIYCELLWWNSGVLYRSLAAAQGLKLLYGVFNLICPDDKFVQVQQFVDSLYGGAWAYKHNVSALKRCLFLGIKQSSEAGTVYIGHVGEVKDYLAVSRCYKVVYGLF